MVYHNEIGGNQVNGVWQAKTTNILPKHTDVCIAERTLGLAEHLGRAIHCKHGHSPAAVQVTSKYSCATADVGDGAKADAISAHKMFKSGSSFEKPGNSEGHVIN